MMVSRLFKTPHVVGLINKDLLARWFSHCRAAEIGRVFACAHLSICVCLFWGFLRASVYVNVFVKVFVFALKLAPGSFSMPRKLRGAQ